jgi:hypothetical protein
MSDSEYTNAVNNKTYTKFGTDSAGYGLAQWTSSDRKKGLLASAQQAGKSIDDEGLQLDYLWNELSTSYKKSVLDPILKTSSAREASKIFMQKFEAPAGYKSSSTINLRGDYADKMLETYGKGPMESWGTGPSTNLSALNKKISQINTTLTAAKNSAESESTAQQVTSAITQAVEKATSSDSSTDQVLKVLTASLSTMIQLLSDIKDNTASNKTDTTQTTTTSTSKIPTVRADNYDSTTGFGTNDNDIGANIIDVLTSK